MSARGGEKFTETRTIRKNGKVVEEITTIKTTTPTWQAAAWLLERLHHDEFGRRIDVNWREKITPQDSRAADEFFRATAEELAAQMKDEPTAKG